MTLDMGVRQTENITLLQGACELIFQIGISMMIYLLQYLLL